MDILSILSTCLSRGDFHVAELATELLRACRCDAETLRAGLLEPAWVGERTAVRARAAEIVRDRGQLDADDARALHEIGRYALDRGLPNVLVARALAEGLDLGAGQLFVDWCLGDRELRPNDPFPVADRDIRKWLRTNKTTGNPSIRTEALDRLPHWRLVPADVRGIRVSMRRLDAQLASLEHIERLGVVVLPEHDVFAMYTWARYTVAGQKMFFGVRPYDAAKLEACLDEAMQSAVSQRVDLLLFPELCTTPEIHARFVATARLAAIPFVVAGSYHTPSGTGPGTNEATLFVRGRPLATHHKFRPVIFPDPLDDDAAPSPTPIPRQEHLSPGEARITVLASGDWSVAILICKDVMDNAVSDLLRDLAVQLVLVPAMSPKTDDFEDLARTQGRDPQGFTLVANFGPVAAVVGTPLQNSRAKSYTYRGGEVLVFDREGRLIIE